MEERKVTRCVILRTFNLDDDEQIKSAGIEHLIVPANAKTLIRLLADTREGFSYSILKTPESTASDVVEASTALKTKRVFVDISMLLPRQNPIDGLNEDGFEFFVIGTQDSYKAFIDKGLLAFEHRYAMIFQSSNAVSTNVKRAKSFGGCVPVFVVLSMPLKDEFARLETELSKFTEYVIFWSLGIVKGLRANIKEDVTKPEPERHVLALAGVGYRDAPSLQSKILGSLKPQQQYPFKGFVGEGTQDTFLRIVVDSKERFAVYAQSGRKYFQVLEAES